MLVGVAIDRVGQQVGADPAVREERHRLARSAVAGDRPALATRGLQELDAWPA